MMLRIAFIIFVLLTPCFLFAESNTNLRFERISRQETTVRSTINQFAQDRLGNLWIATEMGIVRQDGIEEKRYELAGNASRAIRQVLVTDLGKVFLVTKDNELYQFSYSTETFRKIKISTEIQNQKFVLLQGNSNVLILSSDGSVFEIENHSIRGVKKSSINRKLDWNFVSSARDGSNLFINSNNGLLKLDLEQLDLEILDDSSGQINSLSRFGQHMLAGGSRGLFVINQSREIQNEDGLFVRIGNEYGNANVYSLYNENNEFLWVGTYLNGIYVLDKELKLVSHLENIPFDNFTLPSNNVFSVFGDIFGGVWVSTDGGMAYTRSEYRYWNHIRPSTNQTGLQGKSISDIAEGIDGNVLIGTHSGELTLFDSELAILKSMSLPRLNIANAVYKVLKTGNDSWWISHDQGVNEYDKELNLLPNSLLSFLNGSSEQPISVFDIVETPDSFWLATYKQGLVKLGKGQTIAAYTQGNSILNENLINGLYLDSLNRLWILTLNGLFRINLLDDYLEQIDVVLKSSLDSKSTVKRFTVMTEDEQGNFWIGTEGDGILRYSASDDSFLAYDESNGLSNNHVLGIVVEGSSVWVSTNHGLNLIQNEKQQVQTFYYRDGLQDDEFNLTAYLKHSNGDFFFGGVNGFNHIKSTNTLSSVEQPLIKASLVKAESNEQVVFSSQQSVINDLRLDYSDLPFRLDFSAIHSKYRDANTVYFRSDEVSTWQTYTGKGSIQFAKGSSGEHLIEIRGGILKEGLASAKLNLSLSIGYPWWRSNLAYLGYLFVSVLLLFLAYRVRTRALKLKAIKLEEVVAIRTAEIAEQKSTIQTQYQQLEKLTNEKTRFFENLSHEFRTPLTLITGPVKRLLKSANKSDKQQLGVVSRNADRLLHLIEQLLEISRLNSGLRKTKPVNINLHIFVEELIAEFGSLEFRVPVTFVNEIPPNLNISFDHESLQRILINLTSNAVKYNKPHGSVVFSIRTDNTTADELSLIISDTGIGIQQDELPHVFERFSRFENNQKIAGTGIGLALVKELVTLNNSSIQVESKLGVGTQFSIQLKKTDAFVSQYDSIESSLVNSVASQNIAVEISQDKVFEESGKILVVDDDTDMLNFVSSCLSQYHCLVASNGKEALEKALEDVPDIVVTDAMMPVMDGFELVKSIKGHPVTNHIPVLILTARGSRYSRLEGLQTGADDYLAKPFNEDELTQRIDNLLENRRMLREKYTDSILSSSKESVELGKDNQFVRNLELILGKNFSSPDFSVKSLSLNLSMSERQLQRKVKAVLGLSPSEAIRVYRLNQARKRLLNGEQVSQVCYAVGFNSLPHFSREFKEHFKISPSKVC